MKKLNYVFLFVAILLLSCEKGNENVTVLIDQSGYFNVKVVDLNQKGIEGIELKLYYEGAPGPLEVGETDASGNYDFGKLLQGYYEYEGLVEKNGMEYYIGGPIQIIAGDRKSVTSEPFLNIGELRITLVNNYQQALENVNVALIPHPAYSNYTFQQLLDDAYYIRSTNSEGLVNFLDVPAGDYYNYRSYSLMVYYDEFNYGFPNSNNVYVISDEVQEYTLTVYF
ncbi:MAG: hypothetical protein K9H64_01485 [Bacteroidales bacterium]|nr:hypothetical protein [Bacteroidales bacterium]MCF8454576.1 hypothetical protein [Bacteroidales bacterium]